MVVSSVMTTDGVLARRGVLLPGPKMAASERRGVEPDAEDGAVLCSWCSPSSIVGARVPRLSLSLPLAAVAQPDASPVKICKLARFNQFCKKINSSPTGGTQQVHLHKLIQTNDLNFN